MRVLILTMLALLALAPIAAAQEKTNETDEPARPDDAAWVDDCPPDMMCAAGGDDPQEFGPDGCIECSRGPDDGSCEFCRGEDTPNDGSTCMDGASEHEVCRPDVRYLDGGNGDPVADAGSVSAPAETEDTKSVPGASFAVGVAAFALAIFLLARRG